ncbi:TonB-dependent receptor [Sphingomonas oligophenolica]|uniref:TonB-dependent receptor n=1 Tax=Sphingomonas oligophenolica TaxID=301154 RepID=A0ABU9YAE5_9SPHN
MNKIVPQVGLLTLAFAMAGQAQAQTTPEAPRPADPAAASTADAGSSPDIVVTGIRRANQAAIDSKRRAVNITDVVSATDVRALPDNTVAEALRRVPGLSVVPAADNEHSRDEATTAVIRGLNASYNNVTVDGLNIASLGALNAQAGSITRGLRLDILPSSMISEIAVVKTFSPDLDPNAVGGAVNLKTRSAFENGGKPFFTIEGSLGHSSDTGKPYSQPDPGYRLVGTASTTFGPGGMFGAVLSANYQRLSTYTVTHMSNDTVFYNFYNNAGQLQSGNNLGNGYGVPQLDKSWYVEDQRTRYGLTGKLEARPSDQLYLYAMGGYYFFRDDMTRYEGLINSRGQNVQNQTPTSGFFPTSSSEIGYDNQLTTTRTRVGQFGADWKPGEHQKLSLRTSYSTMSYDEPWYMIKYINAAAPRPAPGTAGAGNVGNPALAITYDTSNFQHVFNVNPTAYYDTSKYALTYWRPDMGRNAGDKIFNQRIDYHYNQDEADRGLGFGLGGAYVDDRSFYKFHRLEYDPNNTAPALTLSDVLGPSVPLPYNSLNLLTVDAAKAKAILDALPKSMFNAPDATAVNNQDNFSHHEKIAGAYAMASYHSDQLLFQAGVRYDHTDQSTTSRVRVPGATIAYTDLTTSSRYGRLLPSAIAIYHLTDTLDLRAAYSRTLGRPPYDAYAARSALNFVNVSDIGNPNAIGVTATIGNPNIKPRVSDNFDLSAEWRIPGKSSGLLSLALFDKEIKDEIFTLGTLGYTDPSSGVFYKNAIVSTPVNASSARIRGVEGNVIINSFADISPLLSGFGASANASLLDGRVAVPLSAGGTRTIDRLVGQPNYAINATLFYTTKNLELRAAFNRQGRALRLIQADVSWQDLYWAPRSQLDLSATYQVRPGISLVGQVSNVTRSPITSVTGPGKNLLKDEYSIPATFWLGVRFTPKFR